jgi:metal-sulfur cluster biosynthetic enzyme
MTDSDETTLQRVHEALSTVIDPEIGLDIVTLGLVYEISVRDGVVDVTFTLTTRGCPMSDPIQAGIVNAIADLPGVTEVNPHLVWEPKWSPELIAEGAL